MDYFKNYVSNTLAGTSNQLFFDNADAKGAPSTCMSFYKATVGGEFDYSILFSNAIETQPMLTDVTASLIRYLTILTQQKYKSPVRVKRVHQKQAFQKGFGGF